MFNSPKYVAPKEVRIVAVHQPNFFPWLGYFDKIRRADVFIILDDAQFPKKGGTWSNRVPISRDGSREWLTAPIHRGYSGVQQVREVRFLDTDWRSALLTRLELCYGDAPFAEAAFGTIRPLMENPDDGLADFNCYAIRALLDHVGLGDKKLIRSSELNVNTTGTSRLVDLTLRVGGTAYLSGDGAQGYQEADVFQRHDIKLLFQEFAHPTYHQFVGSAFLPGLSIFDALANRGVDALSKWLREGGSSL